MYSFEDNMRNMSYQVFKIACNSPHCGLSTVNILRKSMYASRMNAGYDYHSLQWRDYGPFPSRTGKTGRRDHDRCRPQRAASRRLHPRTEKFFFFLCVLKNTSERRWVSQELIRATGYRQIMCHTWSEFMHTKLIIPAPIHLATLFFFIPHTNATVPTPLRWGAD